MATVKNSKIFLEGAYSDVTVKVPAETTFKKGLVLGRNANDELTAFTSDVEGSEPLYILAQDIVNEENSAEEFPLVRAFECGAVDKSKIIFSKAADATDVTVLDGLKRNGFSLETVTELTEPSCLAE